MRVVFFIGTSGWVYPHWRGLFYPAELPQGRWLAYYTARFPTVELNNSFYRLPSEPAFLNWKGSTPPRFRFAVKVSRLISHFKKLRHVEEALANFLGRARLLGEKLGPLLYQLPSNLHCHPELLESFLRQLPSDLEHAFEFRHQSWWHEEVYELLRRHRCGFCIYDMPGLTTPVVATAPFAYLRFHGSQSLYGSCYTDGELRDWAAKVKGLGVERAYIYFNNDAEAYAVANARTLAGMLGEALPGEQASGSRP